MWAVMRHGDEVMGQIPVLTLHSVQSDQCPSPSPSQPWCLGVTGSGEPKPRFARLKLLTSCSLHSILSSVALALAHRPEVGAWNLVEHPQRETKHTDKGRTGSRTVHPVYRADAGRAAQYRRGWRLYMVSWGWGLAEFCDDFFLSAGRLFGIKSSFYPRLPGWCVISHPSGNITKNDID